MRKHYFYASSSQRSDLYASVCDLQCFLLGFWLPLRFRLRCYSVNHFAVSAATYLVDYISTRNYMKKSKENHSSEKTINIFFFLIVLESRYSHSSCCGISYYCASHDSVLGRERGLEPKSCDLLSRVPLRVDADRRDAHGRRKSWMLAKVCEVSIIFNDFLKFSN